MTIVFLKRVIILSLMGLSFAGCAVVKQPQAHSYSTSITDVLSGKAILGHGVTEAELPQHDLFNITPEMEAFARKSIRKGENYFEKVKALHIALLSSQESGGRGVIYSAYVTEPPVTTFEQRHANCLSFTLLFTALARSVGIKAYVNEVEIPPTWDLRNRKDMVFLRHVNVRVPMGRENHNILRNDDVVIDLEMNRYKSNYNQHEISDTEAAAQFYSNRAMEFLEANDYINSFLSLRKSISLNDRQSYVWSNLGALYSRKQLWREAELSYLQGLELNSEDLTVMNNLSYLYRQTGNKDQAAKYSRLAQRYRESNPYYQYNLALSAFDQEQYTESLAYILKAIGSETRDARFYELAANIYEKQGRTSKKAAMLKKAAKLKPTEVYKDQ
jgi:Flp pilus assembly protein TadD